ncbi:hypothetical protein Pmani_010370 [Petrolisthes manimaculis]|uniref:Uncharacterized protein n=1 Tax=Petrolisthes manimaculis TaxID=1843537 RepID=A0AAE1Q571_9EUCA|nr:hypothetical protein Pmani_017063 [Petrolisthes manimaculis]KAK4318642.1 hypothetical protein Pmani_010370 [Petrolisthes manimaculis]
MAENLLSVGCKQQYSSQTKLVALRVREYLRSLHPLLNEGELDNELAVATRISVRSLQRFKREAKDNCVSSPPSKRQKTSPVLNSIDKFDEE